MFQVSRRLAFFFVGSLVLSTASAFSADKLSRIEFVVLRAANGKPVRNASVILHPVDKKGRQGKNGMQLKTDPEGKASLDGIPYGKLRIQAIAPGMQTYGDDVEINQPEQQITIKMNKPQEQYSIYK